jgi:endonuclease/exonuclease/phosphatase family metal-dependent hydrolase
VDFKDIIKEIDEEQKKSFKWGESIAFAGAENFIFICVHLSSQKEKNKGQIKNLKEALILLNKCLNKYEIIVGGDLNSFLEPDHDFSTIFKSYP